MLRRVTRRTAKAFSSLLLATALLSSSSTALAEPLWQDSVSDDGRGDGQANDVVATDDAVFVSGFFADETSVPLLRAYDPISGTLLWEDRLQDVAGAEELGRLAVDDGRLFVTAMAARTSASTGFDWMARAYDAATGAVLWTDDLHRGSYDWARRLAAAGGRVFVAGTLGDGVLDRALAVRAYDGATGALAWAAEPGQLDAPEVIPAVVASPDRVFVGAVVDGTARVLAYDAASGDVLWTRDVAGADTIGALALAAGRVVATARDAQTLSIRAYDQATGDLLWQRAEALPGGVGAPITVDGFQLAATAATVHTSYRRNGSSPMELHAYDAADGTPLWSRTTDVAHDLTIAAGRLYATSGAGFFARSFDPDTGRTLWSTPPRDAASALAIAVRGPLVFLAGSSGARFGSFHVEAYDTRTRSLRTIGHGRRTLPTRR